MTTTTLNPFLRPFRFAISTLTTAAFLAFTVASFAADGIAVPATADQLVEQIKPSTNSTKGTGQPREKTDHEKRRELIGISIGAVAVPLGLGIAILAVWSDYKKRQNLIQACHQERMAALDKGLELPPYPRELFADSDSAEQRAPSTGLRPGLILLGLGVGTWFCFGKLAFILVGFGAAYLLYYAIEGRKCGPKN